MANNIFQVKRTSTTGRTPNTTSSGNSQYINAGELALNMTDQMLYTSDGTNLIVIGSNTLNQNITGNLTVKAIIANGSLGTANQVLTTNGTGVYWSTIVGVNTAAQYTFTNTITHASSININNNLNLNFQTVNASTYVGMRQQNDDNFVFYSTNTSGGSRAVWSIYANSITSSFSLSVPALFNTNTTFSGPIILGGSNGTVGQVLTSNGTSAPYWSTVSGGSGGTTSTTARQTYVANGSTNTFTVTSGYTANNLDVYLNGVKLQSSTGVNTSSGSTFTILGGTPANGTLIEVVGGLQYSNVLILTANNSTSLGGLSAFTGSAGQVLTSNGASAPYWSTVSGVGGSVNTAAQYTWTNTQTFSNTITFSTTINGTANNSLYLGGTAAANYQTTAGLSANVATLTANAATYLNGKTEGNLNVNSATTATTANNSSYLGGTAAAYHVKTGADITEYQYIRFASANQSDTNDGKIGSGLFSNGLNIVGNQTQNGNGREISYYGKLWDRAAAGASILGPLTTGNTITIGTAAYFVANGNLGIGTASPGGKLDVLAGNAYFTVAPSTYTSAVVGPRPAGDGISSFILQANSTAGNKFDSSSSGLIVYVNNNSNIHSTFATNGNFGIGTTSPAATLDVVGTVNTSKANTLNQTLTDGATITWDTSLGQIATVTLAGNRTMAAPTNLKVSTYILHVIQDVTGSRTLTWNSVFKWPAGVAPVLSTGANKRDVFTFVSDGTNLYGSFLPDVR